MSPPARHRDFIRRFKRHIEERLLWRPEDSSADESRPARLHAVSEQCAACRLCPLAAQRKQAVAGRGAATARLMILVPAPSRQDDERGEPCRGKPGELLDRMLAAIELTRADVFIAPLVKCRPPEDRSPTPEELATCRRYLDDEVAIIRPRLILGLGTANVASPLLTGDDIPILQTHHPEHLLGHPEAKKEAWAVLKKVRAMLDAEGD